MCCHRKRLFTGSACKQYEYHKCRARHLVRCFLPLQFGLVLVLDVRYRHWNRARYDTDKQKLVIDAISIFDTCIESFGSCQHKKIEHTKIGDPTAEDGEKNTFDKYRIYRRFDVFDIVRIDARHSTSPIFRHIEIFDIQIDRIFRNDISQGRYLDTSKLDRYDIRHCLERILYGTSQQH